MRGGGDPRGEGERQRILARRPLLCEGHGASAAVRPCWGPRRGHAEPLSQARPAGLDACGGAGSTMGPEPRPHTVRRRRAAAAHRAAAGPPLPTPTQPAAAAAAAIRGRGSSRATPRLRVGSCAPAGSRPTGSPSACRPERVSGRQPPPHPAPLRPPSASALSGADNCARRSLSQHSCSRLTGSSSSDRYMSAAASSLPVSSASAAART